MLTLNIIDTPYCISMSCSGSSRHLSAMKASGRSCAHVRRAISGRLAMLDLRENVRHSESPAIICPLGVTKPARMCKQPCSQYGRYSEAVRRSSADAIAGSEKAKLRASGFHSVLLSPSRHRCKVHPGGSHSPYGSKSEQRLCSARMPFIESRIVL